MAEYYPIPTLAESRALYAQIRSWAAIRGDVSIVGGWPVYELVQHDYRMQSRDTDIVLQSPASLTDLLAHLPAWGLELRRKGRRVFPDCTLKGKREIVLDILTDGTFDATDIFGRSPILVKAVPKGTLIPSLAWMVADKVATIPERVRDAVDKRTKDFLDLYGLVFRNLTRVHPRDLLRAAPAAARDRAATFLPASSAWQPKYGSELDAIGQWLQAEG